mmetsp:Transcript_23164/g.17575  ORF Transcript_23164/g.17575 Transcript_23164/m.17575 type:complete len:95 (-) Transcript_23164:650-934(-)
MQSQQKLGSSSIMGDNAAAVAQSNAQQTGNQNAPSHTNSQHLGAGTPGLHALEVQSRMLSAEVMNERALKKNTVDLLQEKITICTVKDTKGEMG